MRDLILQLSKSSIYSTKPIFHNDGTATEFNRFSQFASFSSSSAPSVTAPFRAELSANPAETVVEGPFSKDVILKITYN
ncbi:fimbrial family protein [Escherichia coli]|nr:hypothetical protein A8C72_14740 [Escherichia coli]RCQ21631.1 fimbrial family protein [Escherichia coli]